MVHQLGGSPSVWLAGFYLQTKWMWVDGEGFYYTNWSSQNTASSNPCIYLRSTACADYFFSLFTSYLQTHTMRALIISVLLYMVLAPSGAT
ncbi:hypothetical protein AAFF_G00438700, partial [Aldrovandia affinis]